MHTRQVGTTASLPFKGSRITLCGTTDQHHGIASVTVDVGRRVEIDQYSPTRREDQALYTWTNLSAGQHTLVVTMLSKKNPDWQADGAAAFSITQATIVGESSVTATPKAAGYVFSGVKSGVGVDYVVKVKAITRRSGGPVLTGVAATTTAAGS
jgi:hypothetical protein